VVYLSGGVGGARLLAGLAALLPPERLSAIVNVGDDFEHWGLRVCPDLDSVMYTLAGMADETRGWGLCDETYNALALVRRYGGEDWFALGDRDLATHLMRTARLRDGERLTAVTAELAHALGVSIELLPASDDAHPTWVQTEHDGELSFQDWLVRQRAQPRVSEVRSRGSAAPTAEVLAALERAQLVLIGPSNPYVSIDPILSLPGVRERLSRPTLIAVSPIVAGKAVKGPLAEMIPALTGQPASAAAVARHYGELLDGFVVERGDESSLHGPVLATSTVMRDAADRNRLARATLDFAEQLL
jgi:LPPG:FO 2-phospho-L-lactate transferase